jgi:hypothetical protein
MLRLAQHDSEAGCVVTLALLGEQHRCPYP